MSFHAGSHAQRNPFGTADDRRSFTAASRLISSYKDAQILISKIDLSGIFRRCGRRAMVYLFKFVGDDASDDIHLVLIRYGNEHVAIGNARLLLLP